MNKTQAGNFCQRAQHNQDGLCHCDDMRTAQLLATLASRIKLLQFEVNTSSQACRSFATGGMGCRDTTVFCGQFQCAFTNGVFLPKAAQSNDVKQPPIWLLSLEMSCNTTVDLPGASTLPIGGARHL